MYLYQIKELVFSISSFKKKLYVVGGRYSNNYQTLKSCYVYSLNCDKWSQITDMNVNRHSAVCTFYEGKIVVSGGCNKF